MAARAARLRAALYDAVGEEDVREVVLGLVAGAREGNVAAARELLLRVLGKPLELDLIERLERLEAAIDGGKT